MSRDHAALRRQIGGVPDVAVLERRDVVGEQALQPGRAIGAGNRQNPAIGAPDHAAVRVHRLVAVEGEHVLSCVVTQSIRSVAAALSAGPSTCVVLASGAAAPDATAAAGQRRTARSSWCSSGRSRSAARKSSCCEWPTAGSCAAPAGSARRSTSPRASPRSITTCSGGRSRCIIDGIVRGQDVIAEDDVRRHEGVERHRDPGERRSRRRIPSRRIPSCCRTRFSARMRRSARRLQGKSAGSELRAYIAPQAEVTVRDHVGGRPNASRRRRASSTRRATR